MADIIGVIIMLVTLVVMVTMVGSRLREIEAKVQNMIEYLGRRDKNVVNDEELKERLKYAEGEVESFKGMFAAYTKRESERR